ncbi:efflux RND transporter permease subunit [Desulfomonile tiedjei]|uniref:Cation/multidrug efflux pump n=1 Tax=Desulfomonile tiedjei (strain ATCC 49306 / DSM 6799 / DCB-1) TaxID=706587 RepID=I4C2M3_DESTA|nr:efflux RND transporter permease subunit [Desulfomonile tiedjei]AFM23814.1 cation/multidrug efflux pump [Desulfomonile tiedjei DSM 6799]
MNLAGYAIRHNVVTLVSIILVTVGGILAYGKLGRLEDPEYTIKEAVIYTEYPGATAEEVELEVTEPLETAIQQLKQLKEVRSISRPGLSIIFAEMQEIYDKETLPQVWDELRRRVDTAASHLPPGCKASVVNDDFGDVYGVLFAITGDGYSQHDLKEVSEDLRRELLLCPNVGRIDFWGIHSEAIYVEVDRVKLAQLGLPPTAIFDAINQQNAVTEAGRVKVGPEDVRLRVTGDYSRIEDLGEQLVQGGSQRRMIRLKDVARIERGYLDPPNEILRWNGSTAVGLGVSTGSGGNVIAMGEAIKERLAQLEARIPVGIEIHPIAHQGEKVREAVREFVLGLFEGVLIVILLLVVFMGLREGCIMGAVLLIIVFVTFLCMYTLGITLQRISLGALIIAMGMLVDDAIVVVEGTVIKSHQGMSRSQAAEKTVAETQWPLLGATAIAILAFAAITLSKDMTGEWLKSLFQVICLSLGLSWVFAITVTPYLCVTFLPLAKRSEKDPHDNPFYRSYRKLVGWCIDHRWITLAVVMAQLLIAIWGFGFVKQDFMPDMNRPQFTLDVWLPEGTHIYETSNQVAAIETFVRTLDGVRDVTSFVGRGPLRFLLTYEPEMQNSAYGQLLVTVDHYERISTLREQLTTYLKNHHPNAVTSVDAFKLGPGGGAVVARLSGHDVNTLRDLAEKVRAVMYAHGNTRSIRTDWGDRVKVESLRLADARSREIGVTRPDIARSLAMNFSGSAAGLYRKGDDLLPVMLRPLRDQRCGVDNVDNVQVWSTAQSRWVPIDQVTEGAVSCWEDPVIHRLNRIRTIRVSCKQVTGTTDTLFRQLRMPIESIELPPGYKLEWGGEHEEHEEANQKLMSNVPIAFIAMFLISIMLFNTFRHPLIIFLCLPLAVIGVTAGMLLTAKPFGFMAMLGFLSLSGMLIRNSIVLLDRTNLEIAEGKSRYGAVIDAAVSRVRPVSMAAFSTVLGMTPLLWDPFFAPMAATIMGGLTFATILTLVVVPVLYSTFFRIRR